MRFHRTPPAAALLVLTGLMALAGCSKDKSTNPPNTVAKELDSGNLAPSAQYAHRFFAAGTFPYHCAIHSGMTGAVTVSAAAPASDSLQTVNIAGFAFGPASVAIPTGGKVTWTNGDGTAHTVTSN